MTSEMLSADKYLSIINESRKSIFVCRPCHLDITYGRYDGATFR